MEGTESYSVTKNLIFRFQIQQRRPAAGHHSALDGGDFQIHRELIELASTPLLKIFAKKNNFSFPYLFDEDQTVAKNYGAVCTPDFFGYNENLELQYRGRIFAARPTELSIAMQQISKTGNGPKNQFPSMGCSIKWK